MRQYILRKKSELLEVLESDPGGPMPMFSGLIRLEATHTRPDLKNPLITFKLKYYF